MILTDSPVVPPAVIGLKSSVVTASCGSKATNTISIDDSTIDAPAFESVAKHTVPQPES